MPPELGTASTDDEVERAVAERTDSVRDCAVSLYVPHRDSDCVPAGSAADDRLTEPRADTVPPGVGRRDEHRYRQSQRYRNADRHELQQERYQYDACEGCGYQPGRIDRHKDAEDDHAEHNPLHVALLPPRPQGTCGSAGKVLAGSFGTGRHARPGRVTLAVTEPPQLAVRWKTVPAAVRKTRAKRPTGVGSSPMGPVDFCEPTNSPVWSEEDGLERSGAAPGQHTESSGRARAG